MDLNIVKAKRVMFYVQVSSKSGKEGVEALELVGGIDKCNLKSEKNVQYMDTHNRLYINADLNIDWCYPEHALYPLLEIYGTEIKVK